VAEAGTAAPLLEVLLQPLLPLPRLGAPKGLRALLQILKLPLFELSGGVHSVHDILVPIANFIANDPHL